ncbi:hypothetical protein ABZ695_35095 [Streptomyces sp. NPDC006976]|uniref:hypothetical protein n=1 Tax=Streptomyces sp. NPDC006976 TaxID=3154311 RepID=UPI003401CDDA
MKQQPQPPHILSIEHEDKVPFSARRTLQRAKRRERSGLLFYCTMRNGFRNVNRKWSIVSVEEGGQVLCKMDSTTLKRTKFIDLTPGRHVLTFRVIRARRSEWTSFEQEVLFRKGDVLVAMCDPVQPDTFYQKSPERDTWKMLLMSMRK